MKAGRWLRTCGRQLLLQPQHPAVLSPSQHLAKREAKAAAAAGETHVPVTARPEATFVPGLIDEFLGTLASAVAEAGADSETPPPPRQALLYCERFLEFLVDLLSQLPTRRFVHALLEDRAVLVKCYM